MRKRKGGFRISCRRVRRSRRRWLQAEVPTQTRRRGTGFRRVWNSKIFPVEAFVPEKTRIFFGSCGRDRGAEAVFGRHGRSGPGEEIPHHHQHRDFSGKTHSSHIWLHKTPFIQVTPNMRSHRESKNWRRWRREAVSRRMRQNLRRGMTTEPTSDYSSSRIYWKHKPDRKHEPPTHHSIRILFLGRFQISDVWNRARWKP